MGCGCKGGKKSSNLVNNENGGNKLNLMGKLLKIPTALLLTVFILILSPFLVILVWYIGVKAIFGGESNIVDIVLGKFNKKMVIDEGDVNIEDDFNEDDYELVGVDIIK